MEALKIKDKISTPSTILESGQSVPKKLKKADMEKKETISIEEIPKNSEKAIQELTEHINQMMKEMNFSLKFIPDKEAGQVVIKVLDGNGEVIRQIPPEGVLSLSSNLEEGVGLLLNGKL